MLRVNILDISAQFIIKEICLSFINGILGLQIGSNPEIGSGIRIPSFYAPLQAFTHLFKNFSVDTDGTNTYYSFYLCCSWKQQDWLAMNKCSYDSCHHEIHFAYTAHFGLGLYGHCFTCAAHYDNQAHLAICFSQCNSMQLSGPCYFRA